VKLLIEADGVDVNKADNEGETPLYRAARHGRSVCVQLLIEADGVDVNKANKYGGTPLSIAVWHDQSECMRLRIEQRLCSPYIQY
jgi:cytohesin